MSIEVLRQYHLGDTVVDYLYDRSIDVPVQGEVTTQKPVGPVGLRIYPAELASQIATHRETLGPIAITGLPPMHAWNLESLVQFKLLGDDPGAYHNGLTLRNSASLVDLRFESQREVKTANTTTIITRLVSPRGYACDHILEWWHGLPGFTMRSVFTNTGDKPLTLEMLASFSLSGITPFSSDDAPGRLFIHRFRSNWSAEGRHERQAIETLNLERTWITLSARAERFGHIGSMPARIFFPFAAVEDNQAGVLWGAQLYTPGSWQMEFFRADDTLSLSGGLADREFGHWMKTVAPGESFTAPDAIVSTVHGDLDDLGARLIALQEARIRPVPEVEKDLQVVFNEWCTSWGDPRHTDLVKIADRLQGSGVTYLVIDCGWFKADGGNWMISQGDWEPNPRLFPYGLAGTAQAIRERGLVPGLWFEMEVIGAESPRFNDPEHKLTRDGLPITASGRRFLDFRDPWVVNTLSEKVIKRLHDCGFEYTKLDYNETIGIGVDGEESLGEGLRAHMEGVLSFIEKMRDELPDLVIENCSSGGQRLAPAFLSRASQASFSDAFECLSVPIMAASLQRLVPPRQLQVWAVLRPEDSPQRINYTLAAGFFGRLCLSGDITRLSDERWGQVVDAIRLYKQAAPVIRDGKSRLFQEIGPSWEHPQGAQAVLRVSKDQRQALVVVHSFASPLPRGMTVPLPEGKWTIAASLPGVEAAPILTGNELEIPVVGPFEARVLILENSGLS